MSSDINNLKQKIKELEDIPLASVSGGRQRTSKENELLIKHRLNLKKLEEPDEK